MKSTKNYYGSLCTEMYEILHEKAPQDELNFYLSYAEKGKKILEPLCGSGRFLIPFMERGFDICGMLSMLIFWSILQHNCMIISLFLPVQYLYLPM